MAEEKKVSIAESELKQLLNQNREMQERQVALEARVNELSGLEEQPPTLLKAGVTERKVRVSFLNGKPVIGFKNRGTANKPVFAYERPDPEDPKNRILYTDVLIKGEKDPLTIRYIEFMQEGDHRECVVKSTKEKPWEQIQGSVEAREIKGDDYSPTKRGYEVPVGATGKHITYVVETPEGEELEIGSDYVNIA